jgi:hypothetical protein
MDGWTESCDLEIALPIVIGRIATDSNVGIATPETAFQQVCHFEVNFTFAFGKQPPDKAVSLQIVVTHGTQIHATGQDNFYQPLAW